MRNLLRHLDWCLNVGVSDINVFRLFAYEEVSVNG